MKRSGSANKAMAANTMMLMPVVPKTLATPATDQKNTNQNTKSFVNDTRPKRLRFYNCSSMKETIYRDWNRATENAEVPKRTTAAPFQSTKQTSFLQITGFHDLQI